MIKNDKEYEITEQQLKAFMESEKESIRQRDLAQLELNAIQSMIETLQDELTVYDAVRQGEK